MLLREESREFADGVTERGCVCKTSRSAYENGGYTKSPEPFDIDGCECSQTEYFKPAGGTEGQRELETDSDVPPLVNALRLVFQTQPRSSDVKCLPHAQVFAH